MDYIDKLFHLYETTESFTDHLKAGLINPDSICFLHETQQLYTQGFFIGVEKARYDRIEKDVREIYKILEKIPDYEELSKMKADLEQIQRLLSGFEDTDSLKVILSTLEDDISSTKQDLLDLENKIGRSNGIASLDSEGKLPYEQLPPLKSINGTPITGSGDIGIDLTLYKIVRELPSEGIDPDKIYLVLSDDSVDNNIYTEYVYVDGDWEELGTYKAEVALTTCVKYNEIGTYISSINPEASEEAVTLKYKARSFSSEGSPSVTEDKLSIQPATKDLAGVMTSADKTKLDSIEERATRDEAISLEELDDILI